MSLFSLQLDVGQAGIFLFEKAVALRSYWLSQGIAGHGWDGLVTSVQSLPISPLAARRANKRIKHIQGQTKQVGDWIMGTRKGDMISVLNEQEATWPMVAMLLPLAAVLSAEDAADVLVNLSKAGTKDDASSDSGALVPTSTKKDLRNPMSFETAHSIVTATAPYVGSGYELQEFSKTMKLVLEAFHGETSIHIANCCKWRPSPSDISALMREVSAAASQRDPSTNLVLATNKGIDVLCYFAMMLFDCSVSLQVDNMVKSIIRGQGPSITIVVLPPSQKQAAGTYNYVNARINSQGEDADMRDKQWQTLETRWTLSDYLYLRLRAWMIGWDAMEEFRVFLADHVLSFWWHGHIYGSIANNFVATLHSTAVNHKESHLPAPGPALRELFTVDQVVSRIRAFDTTMGDIVAFRADLEAPSWTKEESCWASLNLQTFAPYCPCRKHKGSLASPTVVGQGCIIDQLHSLSIFCKGVLQTFVFLESPPAVPGIPINCNSTLQELVAKVPSGRHRGEKLDLSHILESAALLLGNIRVGSLAASKEVIGVAANGCNIVPNILLTASMLPCENLIFNVTPGALYCRGVRVSSLRNSSWANTGFFALGSTPISSEDVTVIPAEMFEPTILETGSSPSQILVEAALKDDAGYIAFRINWTKKGEEVSEYISPCDVLYGMSNVLIATCNHGPSNVPTNNKSILMVNAAAIYLSPTDSWDFSYAKSVGLEVTDCLGNFDGIVIQGMRDRGHLMRALRYDQRRVRMGNACLQCAVAFAVTHKAQLVYVD